MCEQLVIYSLQCGPSSQPSVQSETPLHSLLMWMHSSVPPHWYSLGGHRDTVLCGQTSGSSSEPSGQSFSRSQRQPFEMHVTPSLHTNCFGLQVLGASMALAGAITSKLCMNPKKSNPVASMLAAMRNIVAYLGRILLINRFLLLSKAGGCRADRRRRVTVCPGGDAPCWKSAVWVRSEC